MVHPGFELLGYDPNLSPLWCAVDFRAIEGGSGGMLFQEAADSIDRLLALGQERRKHLPYVNHFGPHFELGADSRRLRAIGQASRIVEQCLGLADLNQQRRQALEVSVERRREWRARVLSAEISRGHPQQALALNHPVDRRLELPCLADSFHADPQR